MNNINKVNKKSLCFFGLMLCITAFFGTNYWFSTLYTYDFMVLSSLVLSILTFCLFGFKLCKTNYRCAVVLNILMWISGIMRASGYGLPVTIILKESCYTIVPLLMYFSFKPLIKSKNDFIAFLHALSIAGIVCNIVSIIEMSFSFQNIDILNMDVFNKLRNGTPRFSIGETVVVISFLLSCCRVLDKETPKKNKYIHYFNIGITIINLIWIMKTRTLDLYLLATILTIPVLSKRMKKGIRIMLGFFVIVILSVVLCSDFIPSLNSLIDSDYGIQMRFSMVNYYLNYFKNHWLFGAGYISSNPLFSTHLLVSGPLGRYYLSDVGVIGLLFTSGIIGLAWLLAWFWESAKQIKKNCVNVPIYYELFTKQLYVFLLFSCINLIMTNTPRIPYIAISMLIFESGHYYLDSISHHGKNNSIDKEIKNENSSSYVNI